MKQKTSLLLGNFLEFYDFTLFAYLIPIVAPLLFPSKDVTNSYVTGYIFLAIGFLSRPLGAILFGHIGDIYGRKKAVILSILLMSISTITISFLPVENPNWISVFVLLSICRVLQGLSAGGEYSGTGLLLIENTKEESQFLNGSILTASALLGAFAASLAAAIMSAKNYSENGWRILFFGGGIIGFVALWLRFTILDNDNDTKSQNKVSLSSWFILFKEYKKPLLLTIFCSALMNVPFQMVTVFLNTYLVATGDFERTSLMFVNAIVVLFCAIITVIFGLCTKILNPIKALPNNYRQDVE